MSDPADPPSDSPRSTRDWLVDLCVYAPIGFALDASRYLPEFAAKGRDQVTAARFLGRYAVQHLESQLGPLGPLLKAVIGIPTPPASDGGTSSPSTSPPESSAHTPPSEPSGPSELNADQRTEQDAHRGGSDEPVEDADHELERPPGEHGPHPAPPVATPEIPPSTPSRSSRTARTPRPRPEVGAAAPTSKRATTGASARQAPVAEIAPAPDPAAPARSAGPGTPASPAPPADPVDAAEQLPLVMPPGEELAIEGYANLAVSQVLPRLATLGAAELEAIARYERGHRARRTVLKRVAQLQAEG